MREFKTEIDIDAPPEDVWVVLADTRAYGEWNPLVHRLDGKLKTGEKIAIDLYLGGEKAMRFTPVLKNVEPGRELRWLGRLFVPGLFDGEHYFRLEPKAGGTRLVHGERFSGILVPLLLAIVGKKTERGFRALNTALKQRAETPPQDRR